MRDTYADIFSLRGNAYHEACRRWPHARDAEFHAALEPLRLEAGATLLDAPSGGGYLADHLPTGVRHLALDPAACFAAFAGQRPGCTAVEAPLDATGLADASVDAVVSVAGLHHAEDRGAIYTEWARVARPGARCSILDVAVGSPEDGFLNVTVDALNPDGHDGDFLGPADIEFLGAAGWDIESAGRVAYTWDFESRHAMGEFVRLLFGMSRAADAEQAVEAIGTHCRHHATAKGWALEWGLQRIAAVRRA